MARRINATTIITNITIMTKLNYILIFFSLRYTHIIANKKLKIKNACLT